MVLRGLAFVLALFVGGAPVVVEACQLTCAWTMKHADAHGTSHSHSCQHEQSANTTTISPVPHACGHTDELPPSSLVSSTATCGIALPVGIVVAGHVTSGLPGTTAESLRRSNRSPRCTDARASVPLRI
jgi:hypothetical protein